MTITAQTVLFNFSQDTYAMTGNWNNVLKGTTNTDTLSTIIDNSGATTNFKLKVKDAFDGYNSSGYTTTTGDANTLGFSGNASKSSLYIMSASGKAIIRLWGLDINKVYSFSFYAGHMYPTAGEIKQGKLTVSGLNTASDTLNASYNNNRVKTISNISPTTNGYIDLTLEAGPNNNSGSKYAYLAALRMVESTPVSTSIKNTLETKISANLYENNLVVGDYTGVVKVYAVNGKLVANGQSVFGYMPLQLPKGVYVVETTQGRCKLLVR